MTKWEREERERKERELKDRLRGDLPPVPELAFEELWQHLKQMECVDEVLEDLSSHRERIDKEVLGKLRSYRDLVNEAMPIARFKQHESKRAGYAGTSPGPASGRSVQPPLAARLGEYEEEYAAALSAYYALAAGAQPEVERLRDEILPDGLLSREDANRLLTSRAAALLPREEFERWGIPLLNHEAVLLEEDPGRDRYRATVSVSPPGVKLPVEYIRYQRRSAMRELHYVDEEGYSNWVSVLRGSLLDGMRGVSVSLAKRYGWEEAEATRFLLTGKPPFVSPLTGRPGGRYITLKAAPYISARTVGRFFLQLQHETGLGISRQHTAKGARVLRFVLEQLMAESKPPSWAELTRRWNETHPEEGYGDASRDGLKKAYERAREEIIEPHWTVGDYQHLPPIVTGIPRRDRS